MSSHSAIEWTDASWTPIRARNRETGKLGWHCEHATTGCEFCYAERMNKRLGTGLPFKPGHRKDIDMFVDDDMLLAPLRWRKPRMIFVCSMTDLFAEFVKDEWIDRVFAVMALCPQHVFQVLSKRSERMWDYMCGAKRYGRVAAAMVETLADAPIPRLHVPVTDKNHSWPLPHVWLGVSAERQQEADERIPHLLETPAAIRFVRAEPLLGAIDLRRPLYPDEVDKRGSLIGGAPMPGEVWSKLDWVITGGESGPRARPMMPKWARSLHAQCEAAGVAFFHKQNGEWIDADAWLAIIERSAQLIVDEWPWRPGRPLNFSEAATLADLTNQKVYQHQSDGSTLIRVGKKAAGRLLHGCEYNEFPDSAPAEARAEADDHCERHDDQHRQEHDRRRTAAQLRRPRREHQ